MKTYSEVCVCLNPWNNFSRVLSLLDTLYLKERWNMLIVIYVLQIEVRSKNSSKHTPRRFKIIIHT